MWRRIVDSRALPLALLGVFALLIALVITRFSVWFDESASITLVGTRGYSEILRFTKFDVHPPLWYLVLKPWLQVFGSSILAARAESAVFMFAGVAIWYRVIALRWSRSIALVALALMVTSPMLLHYAVEARMYAFGVLLVAVSTLLVTGSWRWKWFAYWPCAVAILYTHYFLSFALAAQFLYLALRRERSLRWLALYGASIVLAFSPWLPVATTGTKMILHDGFWVRPVVPSTGLSYVLTTFLHRNDADLSGVKVFPALAYLATFGALVVRAARQRGAAFTYAWCLVLVPCALLFVLSCKPLLPVFHPRYVIFGLPALIALLVAGAWTISGRWRVVAIAVLLIGHLEGEKLLRWRGFSDVRGYWAMKAIAREASAPIDGEVPTVVGTTLFTFFDARATLPMSQHVLQLRDEVPANDNFPDILYYDRHDWWVLSLDEIHARHVWVVDDAGKPPTAVPTSWRLVTGHLRGYAHTRLFDTGK